MNKKNTKYLEHDVRPWGEYIVIESRRDFKIKKIDILPGQRLSYQFHKGRSETWVIIQGKARVTIDGIETTHHKGDTIIIPKKAKHRIESLSKINLVFIEIQTGDYFDEDDIIRIQDDYNR